MIRSVQAWNSATSTNSLFKNYCKYTKKKTNQ